MRRAGENIAVNCTESPTAERDLERLLATTARDLGESLYGFPEISELGAAIGESGIANDTG